MGPAKLQDPHLDVEENITMIQEHLIWRESDINKIKVSIVLSRHFPGQETETKSNGKMAVVTSEKGVVTADHETCSEIGADVLRRLGGTAVDAAVAVAFSLGV
ncbi:unnamed protein product [Brassica oleracea var. botrytis]